MQVCAPCRDDRRRCPEPRPERRSLGTRARVLEVDSAGRYVLHVNWYGTCGVFDLAAGRIVKPSRYLCRARSRLARRERRPQAVVLPSGAVAMISGAPALMGFVFDGTRIRSLSGEVRHVASTQGLTAPAGILAAGNAVVTLVNWTEQVEVDSPVAGYVGRATVDLIDVDEGRLVQRHVVPGRIVTGAVCVASRLLALGGDRNVALHDLDTLEPLIGLPTPASGLAWIALGEGILGTVASGVLRVERWEGRVPGVTTPIPVDPAFGVGVLGPCHASLSPDGRLLAARAPGGGLVVIDLEGGAAQRLAGTSDLEFVRFVGGDRLICASAAELSIWQRHGTRIGAPRTAGY